MARIRRAIARKPSQIAAKAAKARWGKNRK
jgi:hypothetical protein